MTVQSISAITLAVQDMKRSVAFYHQGAGIPSCTVDPTPASLRFRSETHTSI